MATDGHGSKLGMVELLPASVPPVSGRDASLYAEDGLHWRHPLMMSLLDCSSISAINL